MSESITAIVYSYKNKNLPRVISDLVANTESDISIYVYDQHQIDRSKLFEHDCVIYNHVFWDYQISPIQYKSEIMGGSKAEYFLIMSDEIITSKGWDIKLINFLKNKKAVISGTGKTKLVHKDKYFIGYNKEVSSDFELTQFSDKNFIFGKRDHLNSFMYPEHLKFYGEDEYFSISFWRAGIDIYSVPSGFYTMLNENTILTKYVPFSKEHNYDKAIDLMLDLYDSGKFYRTSQQWLDFHNLDRNSINKLPYQNNDVLYDPNRLEFQDIDARKFISNTKAVY